jgi:hypothetical protein
MVISGSGPNLIVELKCSRVLTGFPNPDLFDHFAHSGRRLLSPPYPGVSFAQRFAQAAFAAAGTL